MKPQLEQFLSLVKDNQKALEEFKEAINQRNKVLEKIDLIQNKLNETFSKDSLFSISNSSKPINLGNLSTQDVMTSAQKTISNDDSLIERIKKINQRNQELIQQNEQTLNKKITIK